jgi:putative DeoR family transcriptional regulator (stage III sporulation protein D)
LGILWDYIEERVLQCAEYIVATGCTVRACSARFGISKSTVHKDVSERLLYMDADLYERVRAVLDFNLSERHVRGGEATKTKYDKQKRLQTSEKM